MKYNVTTAGYFYPEINKDMEELGAIFKKSKPITLYNTLEKKEYIITWKNVTVEINTLEEIQAFIKKFGKCVLTEDTIIIYDYYLE